MLKPLALTVLKNNSMFKRILLALSFSLISCQIQQVEAPLSFEQHASLEQEYAVFKTQALTQSYLARKVNHWLDVGNGESLRREMDFARYKHPALLTTLMEDNALCAQTLAVPEVVAYQAQNVDFDAYVSLFSCATAPLQGEFQVNTYTTDSQQDPAIAMNASGDFVVTWLSNNQDGDSNGVYAQRYNAAGIAQGSEFLVNTQTVGVQGWPTVAIDANGNFVIAWSSLEQDGSGHGIYAQRYNAAGVAQGSEFLVNTYTTDDQTEPSIAMNASGDFVVAWHSNNQDGSSHGIYAQRYNAAGVAQGSEFQVNTYTTSLQYQSSVAIDDDGNFVVTWTSHNQDGDGLGIFAQRYNAAGVAQGSEFQVNTYTPLYQSHSSVAMDASGNFVVAWDSLEQDGSGDGVYAQRFNAAGVAQGSEFRVNTYTTSQQRSPSVAMNASGHFVITWNSQDQDGFGNDIYAQRFNAAGDAQGSEFLVNTYTENYQEDASVAMDANGNFVIVWESYLNDLSSNEVLGQRYNTSGIAQ